MILLVTPSDRAEQCAAAVTEATAEEVTVAESLRRATVLTRTESYSAVVLDQYLVETEPDEINTLLQHLGTAIPLQVNLGISGIDRLVREVRAALRRRKREEAVAHEAAMHRLHSELNETITALLLSCELMLESPELPAASVEKLRSIHELVQKLRTQVQPRNSNGFAPSPEACLRN